MALVSLLSLLLLSFSLLSTILPSAALPTNAIQSLDLEPANRTFKQPKLPGASYDTPVDLPGAWPKLQWWTKIQESNPTAFLDIYSVGSQMNALEAYALQELVLIPLSFKVYGGVDPADKAESTRSEGMEAMYLPMEQRPPSREVAAKAITALAFMEKRFGARTVKAGLRLGMVKVASIEVRRSNGETM